MEANQTGDGAPRVLVVDDEEDLLSLLEYNLDQAGFEALLARDGMEALNMARDQDPDLIILDIMMPKMDGMELLRRVRQTSELPVIFLTSKDEEIDEVIGFNIGADDFVRKPCSNRLLSERVKAVLRRARAGEPGEELERVHHVVVDAQLGVDAGGAGGDDPWGDDSGGGDSSGGDSGGGGALNTLPVVISLLVVLLRNTRQRSRLAPSWER